VKNQILPGPDLALFSLARATILRLCLQYGYCAYPDPRYYNAAVSTVRLLRLASPSRVTMTGLVVPQLRS
jgi:hypothetical protein